ncbi:hypothetical protein [Mucilaginibacter xinganensis]|uniref:Uncharacterized protein n=1 Tax=Mucilaginibacter xinganensis TaxID=1234841 RepID=A0A223NQ87_9SPHI|nr:hypothetical protein [Mucilaginibacter xinganensis]ASU31966.1 hypothetical protein MuYL_0063 [Mucilaginibacter xinganensis]
MNSIKFNFSHPVSGRARLLQLTPKTNNCRTLAINSKEDNTIEIPVNDCQCGKWKLELSWEYEGRDFSHQEEFEVEN